MRTLVRVLSDEYTQANCRGLIGAEFIINEAEVEHGFDPGKRYRTAWIDEENWEDITISSGYATKIKLKEPVDGERLALVFEDGTVSIGCTTVPAKVAKQLARAILKKGKK